MSIVLILFHTIWWIFISMLGQNMFLHFILCDITFVTEFTGVSFFPCVHFFMLFLASHINEFAFTKLTSKGFHTRVYQFMPFPIAPFGKTCVTNYTCIWFYSSVAPYIRGGNLESSGFRSHFAYRLKVNVTIICPLDELAWVQLSSNPWFFLVFIFDHNLDQISKMNW